MGSYAGETFQREIHDFAARDRQSILRSQYDEQYHAAVFDRSAVPERIVRRIPDLFTLKDE